MRKRFILTVVLAAGFMLFPLTLVRAATITVGTGKDYATIAEAIASASDDDVIDVYGTITEAGITVNKNLTIQGQGVDNTIVQAHATEGLASNRVFTISADKTVTLKDMTIRHGKDPDNSGAGGICADTGSDVTVSYCAVLNNTCSGNLGGGGIYAKGSLTIEYSTISANSNTSTLGSGGGGGIKNTSGMTLSNSTVYNNTSARDGGGILCGNATITNCTISGNSSGANGTVGGGGIYTQSTVIITNCTITDNTATNGSGGGLRPYYATISLKNTIIAGNHGTNPDISKTGGSLTSLDYNLVENVTGADGCINGTHDITGEDPLLAALADNGGPTQTHALQEGSPAINAGTDSDAPTTDQRGYSRCEMTDIGAFEYNGEAPTLAPDKPSIISPANEATGVGLTPTLEGSEYSGPEGTQHLESQWQIDTDEDFNTVFDSGACNKLEEIDIPCLVFGENTTYYARLRYKNENDWSEWSDVIHFTTVVDDPNDANGNGVPDNQESSNPNLDMDNNGTPDSEQADILIVENVITNEEVGIKTSECIMAGAVALNHNNQSVDSPAGYGFPYGLFSCRIECEEPGKTVRLTYYLPYSFFGSWYKYDNINGWYDYGDHIVEYNGSRIVIEVKDGGFGDSDGVENGVIVDPGGPAYYRDSGEDGGNSGCFFNNIFQGTAMSHSIILCRNFRDNNLLTNPVGRMFVTTYYKASPSAVKFINEYPVLKNVAREILRPVVWLSGKI